MPRREGKIREGVVKDKIFDPYAAFNFILEIEGITSAGFSECSGLQMETKVFEYKEGGNNQTTLKFPEHSVFGNITLKRGITASNDLINWQFDIVNGTFKIHPRAQDKNLAIILRDELRRPVKRWNLKRAFPIKWTGPDLKANANEVAIESLEIAHEGIKR